MAIPVAAAALGAASALTNALGGSQSSGGSVNSGHSASYSSGGSWTNAAAANQQAIANAERANALQKDWWNEEMDYNSREAEKTRAFNELMGNTIYTRSVADMIRAGINPVLAASFGLSAAQVNSSAMASTSAPSTHMAQTFMDSGSAYSSESNSENEGKSWNSSESGLATGLSQLGQFIESGLQSLSSAKLFDITIGGNTGKEMLDATTQTVKQGLKDISNKTKNFIRNGKFTLPGSHGKGGGGGAW